MKTVTLLSIALIAVASITNISLANEQTSSSDGKNAYSIFALSANKLNNIAFNEQVKLSNDWQPTIGLGIGQSYQLSENWQMSHELVFEYGQSSVSADYLTNEHSSAQNNFANSSVISGQLTSKRLWLNNRITRQNLFANAAPFVELDLGLSNYNFHSQDASNQFDDSTNKKSYRALVGMTFDVADSFDLSIAVGHQNVID